LKAFVISRLSTGAQMPTVCRKSTNMMMHSCCCCRVRAAHPTNGHSLLQACVAVVSVTHTGSSEPYNLYSKVTSSLADNIMDCRDDTVLKQPLMFVSPSSSNLSCYCRGLRLPNVHKVLSLSCPSGEKTQDADNNVIHVLRALRIL